MKNSLFVLTYFKAKSNIYGDDFKEQEKKVLINIEHLSSVSILEMFKLPASGTDVEKASIVSMVNGDRWAIKEKAYNELMAVLKDFYL